jgi:hypothetical protein
MPKNSCCTTSMVRSTNAAEGLEDGDPEGSELGSIDGEFDTAREGILEGASVESPMVGAAEAEGNSDGLLVLVEIVGVDDGESLSKIVIFVGAELGTEDGIKEIVTSLVGPEDGAMDKGPVDGAELLVVVGEALSTSVGMLEGRPVVGIDEGTLVGIDEGTLVGIDEGTLVGAPVGVLEGFVLGEAEGGIDGGADGLLEMEGPIEGAFDCARTLPSRSIPIRLLRRTSFLFRTIMINQ